MQDRRPPPRSLPGTAGEALASAPTRPLPDPEPATAARAAPALRGSAATAPANPLPPLAPPTTALATSEPGYSHPTVPISAGAPPGGAAAAARPPSTAARRQSLEGQVLGAELEGRPAGPW